MSTRKDRDARREHEHREHEGRERAKGTGYGKERVVYLEYLARRWQGSAPPTAEAYARALKQWHQLPGSVVTVPSDVVAVSKPASLSDTSHLLPKPPSNPGDKDRRS